MSPLQKTFASPWPKGSAEVIKILSLGSDPFLRWHHSWAWHVSPTSLCWYHSFPVTVLVEKSTPLPVTCGSPGTYCKLTAWWSLHPWSDAYGWEGGLVLIVPVTPKPQGLGQGRVSPRKKDTRKAKPTKVHYTTSYCTCGWSHSGSGCFSRHVNETLYDCRNLGGVTVNNNNQLLLMRFQSQILL